MREALGWAGRQLASPVVAHQRLVGGMTSTMLALDHADGSRSVLRLMTEEPWRTHGAALTARERAALLTLADTPVPAPRSLALDAAGSEAGVSAHLMTLVPGRPVSSFGSEVVAGMAQALATIHDVVPDEPFRAFQSWAPPEKWVVPSWSVEPDAWRWAFDVLAGAQPAYEPCLVHRDFGHRNLLWLDGRVPGVVSGVVDWVETSTGPRWLDAGHAATNLAVAGSPGAARAFLDAYAAESGTPVEPYWLVMDAVGFLPFPGGPALFSSDVQHARLDDWVGWLARRGASRGATTTTARPDVPGDDRGDDERGAVIAEARHAESDHDLVLTLLRDELDDPATAAGVADWYRGALAAPRIAGPHEVEELVLRILPEQGVELVLAGELRVVLDHHGFVELVGGE